MLLPWLPLLGRLFLLSRSNSLALQAINNLQVSSGNAGRGLQRAAPAVSKLDPILYPIDITGPHLILELGYLIGKELFHRFIHKKLQL